MIDSGLYAGQSFSLIGGQFREEVHERNSPFQGLQVGPIYGNSYRIFGLSGSICRLFLGWREGLSCGWSTALLRHREEIGGLLVVSVLHGTLSLFFLVTVTLILYG
ncbi:hypothetical protein, partial [Aeromonas hydrophila]|uniref:hypothetical protein n=1 Tax=Aeromonas hydrophila TaxID=644 RepID=UPI00195B52B2